MAKGKVGQSPEKITLRAGIQKQLALGFRPSHGHLKEYAQTTGVTPRTIQNWISDMVAGREPQKRGRKGPTDEKVRLAREHIESVLKINGWDSGEETVMNALKANGTPTSMRLIRRVLKDLKAERRAHVERERAARRITIVFNATDVCWAQDATELERDDQGKITAELVRDTATRDTGEIVARRGDSDSQDAIAALNSMAEVRGALPLMVGTDNGSPYTSAAFEGRLEEERIVHFKNLPRTPRHNPIAERAVREIKSEADWALVPDHIYFQGPVAVWTYKLAEARRCVRNRIRQSPLGRGTVQELDKRLPKAYDLVDRNTFYAAAQEAMAAARQAHAGKRKQRLAERHAVLKLLWKYGLIDVYRGGARLVYGESEINS